MKIYASKSQESLSKKLAEILRKDPCPPFREDTVITQSYPMQQYLHLRLASDLGISFGLRFFYADRFASLLINQLQDKNKKWDYEKLNLRQPNVARWILLQLLSSPNQESELLRGEKKQDHLFEFALEIAALFRSYDLYREPNWLLESDKFQEKSAREPKKNAELSQEHYHLQRKCWQEVEELCQKTSFSALSQNQALRVLIEEIKKEQPSHLKILKKDYPRIFLFGITKLPPLQMAFFEALATVVDLRFFFLEIGNMYQVRRFAEQKSQERARQTGFDLPAYRWMMDQWLGHSNIVHLDPLEENKTLSFPSKTITEDEIFLTRLKRAFYLSVNTKENAKDFLSDVTVDDSFLIFYAENKFREVEALRDALVQLMKQNEGQDTQVMASDILVMAPDINQYLPLIKGIFAHLTYSVADEISEEISLLADEFCFLLDILVLENFPSQSALFALKDSPKISRAFAGGGI